MPLRVATYNIRLGLEQGLSAVANVLSSLDVDVVALQEAGVNWVMGEPVDQPQVVSQHLGLGHVVFTTTITRGEVHHFGHALLSRFPILDVEHVDCPRHRDEPRRYTIARLALPNGTTTTIVWVHLSHLDDERTSQVDALFERLTTLSAHTPRLILLGDLNEPTPALLESRFARAGLTDSGAQENALTFPSGHPTDRRDVIAFKGFTPLAPLRIVDSRASDHRPIVVDLDPA